MSDLRERVARALNARCFDGCEDGEAGFRACVDPPCPCRAAASAVIAIVLEEAARCAENYPRPESYRARIEIAAAIRALTTKDH